MRISTPQMFRQSVIAMQDNQADVARTQLQIATGKRILTPADDPIGAKQIVELDTSAKLSDQFQRNADAALNRLSLEEDVLARVTDVLHRVRELAVQSNAGFFTNQDRAAIAVEVRGLLDELVTRGNARDNNNEYLFAGFQGDTEPFGRDAGGNFVYNGDQGQRFLQIGPNYRIAVSDPGSAVFQEIRNGNGTFTAVEGTGNTGTGIVGPGSVTDPAAWVADTYTISILPDGATYEVTDGAANLLATGTFAPGDAIRFNGAQVSIIGQPAAGDTFTVSPSTHQDLFTTVQNLVDALELNVRDDASRAHFANAVGRFLSDVDLSMEKLLQVRADLGARLGATEAERDVNEGFALFTRETLAAVEDLDYAEAVSRFELQLTALQASQQAFVKLQGLSLFSILG